MRAYPVDSVQLGDIFFHKVFTIPKSKIPNPKFIISLLTIILESLRNLSRLVSNAQSVSAPLTQIHP